VGAAVIVALGALQVLLPLLDRSRPYSAPPRAAFLLIEMPLAMVALTATYNWTIRRRLGWARTLLATLATSLAMAILAASAALLVVTHFLELSTHLPGRLPGYQHAIAFGSLFGLVQCGIWALAFVYPFAAEESRLRSLEAEKLRQSAEVARLRSQLEPHFLLNTLNAIAGLVTQNPGEARRLLACLGDLLGEALHDAEETQTVDHEIEWLHRYTDILESRYRGALSFHWEIDRDVGSAVIPRLLLQPLVENAVKHGALSRSLDGRVAIKIFRAGGPIAERLICSIEDNGNGAADVSLRSDGFGLRAVRRRLELRYADASLQLQSSQNGTIAIVELPLTRTSEPSARP